MKKNFKRIGLSVLVLVVIVGVAFVFFMKKSEENFEALMEMQVPDIDLSTLSDGSYSGAYSVFPVSVEVTVEVVSHEIVSIEIDKHVNGQGGAAEVIVDEVVRQQSIAVDVVSGATYSSKVILMAIEDAIGEN